MADRIQPTPRNKLLGLLADSLSGVYDYAQRPDPTMPMGKANPVLGLLADALPLKAGANVLDDLSYGQAPIRGTGMTTRLTPDATELAMAAAPFPKTSSKAALAALGAVDTGMGKAMFIGPTAKTWDKAAAATAQKLEKAGADPRAIWSETGTFKGPDGKWRQEISDDAAKLRDYNYTPQEAFDRAIFNSVVGDGNHAQALAMRPYAGMTKNQLTGEYARTGGEIVDAALAGDKAKATQLNADRAGLQDLLSAMRDRPAGPASSYLSHGELGQAYPDVYKLHTRISEDIGPARGEYVRGNGLMGEQIRLSNKPRWSEDKSMMLHELQHAIQRREGFARGGSPTEFAGVDAASQRALDEINAILNSGKYDMSEYQTLLQRKRDILNNSGSGLSPYEQYRRLAGEAEARATQARMNMTPDERRATFPLDSYDVPVDQVVVRMGGDAPQMVIDREAKNKLIQELSAGRTEGPYRLGDVTPGQSRNLLQLTGSRAPATNDVMLTPDAFAHIYQGRVVRDGFTPLQVADVAEKALERRSRPTMDPASRNVYPSLVNQGLLDLESGRRYAAVAPLRPTQQAFDLVTVVPDGLPAPKKKPRQN